MNFEVKDIDTSEWKEIGKSYISNNDIKWYSEFTMSDKYSIIERHFENINKKENHYWNQVKYDIYKDNILILSFNRNYPSRSPMAYIEANGKEYLIASGDYQCITIINLTDAKIESYCYGNHDVGLGFCPIEYYVSNENGNISIKVEGCFWGDQFSYFYLDNPDLNDFKFPENLELIYEETESDEEDQ